MRYLYMSLSVFMMLSCISDYELSEDVGDINDQECFPITVSVDTPRIRNMTKSSFSSSEVDQLTDLNIFVYHQGCLLESHSRYFSDISSLMLSFPYGKDDFNIYMLGNVGKVDPPCDEEDLPELCHVIDSYDDFRSCGVPIAASFKGYRKGTLAHFPLKRLVGQYNIRMRTSAENAVYEIRDVRLLNCALDVFPFATDAKATIFTRGGEYGQAAKGDVLTTEDVAALNDGDCVSLYFVENLQGVLLPDNTDRRAKIPSSLAADVASRCTYLEITADVTTASAKYTDAKYRFYLGQDMTTDFSIRRNTLYDIVLDFTQNMVSEEEWRIEADAPQVADVKIDKEVAMVIKGAEDMIYIQAYDKDGELLDFDVDLPGWNVTRPDDNTVSCANVQVQKVYTDYREYPSLGRALGLRFSSNREIDGMYPIDAEPAYETTTVRLTSRETYNGNPLYTKDIEVRTYYKLFPLLIKLEKSGTSYRVVLRGRNPLGLGVSLSSSYTFGDSSGDTATEVACNSFNASGVLLWGAVNMSGTVLGVLDDGVTSANLSRIDFTVSGCNSPDGSGDVRPCYPRLLAPSEVLTGPDSQAVFGPGSNMCPGKLPALSDDAKYYMTYDYNGSMLTNSYNEDYESNYASTSTFAGMCEGWITSTNRASEFPYNYGSAYFFAHYYGVHLSQINNNAAMYSDFSQYEGMPFYFVNGGLVESQTTRWFPTKIVRYPNKITRGVEYEFLGCGRDLFAENHDGSVVDPYHRMGMKITSWKPMIGSRINTHQYSRYYTSQLYMTINGASCWCGNDLSEYGYHMDGHL